jgi:hypothetical protein
VYPSVTGVTVMDPSVEDNVVEPPPPPFIVPAFTVLAVMVPHTISLYSRTSPPVLFFIIDATLIIVIINNKKIDKYKNLELLYIDMPFVIKREPKGFRIRNKETGKLLNRHFFKTRKQAHAQITSVLIHEAETKKGGKIVNVQARSGDKNISVEVPDAPKLTEDEEREYHEKDPRNYRVIYGENPNDIRIERATYNPNMSATTMATIRNILMEQSTDEQNQARHSAEKKAFDYRNSTNKIMDDVRNNRNKELDEMEKNKNDPTKSEFWHEFGNSFKDNFGKTLSTIGSVMKDSKIPVIDKIGETAETAGDTLNGLGKNIHCECDKYVLPKNMSRHKKTKAHLSKLK